MFITILKIHMTINSKIKWKIYTQFLDIAMETNKMCIPMFSWRIETVLFDYLKCASLTKGIRTVTAAATMVRNRVGDPGS